MANEYRGYEISSRLEESRFVPLFRKINDDQWLMTEHKESSHGNALSRAKEYVDYMIDNSN